MIDDAKDLLCENDLYVISGLYRLLISRLTESSISKKMRLGDALNHEHL